VIVLRAQFAVLIHGGGPARGGGVGDHGLEGSDLVAQGGERAERGLHLLPERAVAAEAHFLGEIGQAGAARHRHLAAVGRLQAGDNFEQGALAGAVDAHKCGLLAARHLKVNILENQLGAEVFF
jgi:hypothetical protein